MQVSPGAKYKRIIDVVQVSKVLLSFRAGFCDGDDLAAIRTLKSIFGVCLPVNPF